MELHLEGTEPEGGGKSVRMKVYLAGPINGCTDKEAGDWRSTATSILQERGIDVLDPMARDYRGIEDENVNLIVKGDKEDIDGCHVLLANCPKPSVGTSMEVFFAHLRHKTVVVVAPEPVSPWLRYHATDVFQDLDEALAYINALL